MNNEVKKMARERKFSETGIVPTYERTPPAASLRGVYF